MNAFLYARRFALRAILLCAAVLAACALYFAPSPVAAGAAGQAVALRAAQNPAGTRALLQKGMAQNNQLQNGLLRVPGRQTYDARPVFLTSARTMSVKRRPNAAGPNPILISEGVQTFDVFAPPPGFETNLPAGPLTPTNAMPVWSADEKFILFSSNRDASGSGVAADGLFHIWSVPVGGGAATQITSGPGNEFYPALNPTNSALAFTSDAQSPGNQQLYIIGGSSGVPFVSGQAPVDVSALTSPNTNKTLGTTLFTNVARPTWAPGGDRLAFAATTSSDAANAAHTAGVSHLYFLYVATNGYQSQPQAGTANPPVQLTDGAAADTDPAWSPDGNYICFASTASSIVTTGQQLGPNTSPTLTNGNRATRTLFLLSGGTTAAFGTVTTGLPGGRVTTLTGADDSGPAWSTNTQNPYFNPNGTLEYLAFARALPGETAHDIYYFRLADLSPGSVAPLTRETSATGTNAPVHLNTDDAGNIYDDVFPTWAPFASTFSIGYQSNRSVTYNDPASTVPLETAVSLARGTGGVGAQYEGLLESQVLNLDPPSLLRYSGNEVVHVQNGAGATTRNLQPSTASTVSPIRLVVRVSNREAGTDPSRVFVQIKDPDSRYQDSQGLEHKCFVSDPTAPNPTQGNSLNSAAFLYNGIDGLATLNHGSNKIGNTTYYQYGVVGGADGSDTISVGHLPAGVQETLPLSPMIPFGTAPTYQAFGPEWECQFLNPTVANPGTATGDYGTPYYLAGFDDQPAFSGNNALGAVDVQGRPLPPGLPRPTADSTTTTGGVTTTTYAEWLQLTQLPVAQQDGKGGVLYGATYNLPISGSDFYVDVIAYDQATFPNIAAFPVSPAVTGKDYHGQSVNWRIYDNVGGFTSAQFGAVTGANDILVVSDNALGQKFSATSFGQNGNANLLPTFFGAESYYTDIDLRFVPNAVDFTANMTVGGLQHIAEQFVDGGNVFVFTGAQPAPNLDYPDALNGLGVNSYNDSVTDDGGRINASDANLPSGQTTASFVRSQKYSLWRILSRGPIPSSVLAAYQPGFVSQPAVVDTVNGINEPLAKVPVATHCVIWVSPYTGDLPLEDAGSLANPSTQDTLRAFVNAGGRLCITGQDVAATLSLKGASANTFLSDVLGAQFLSGAGGTQTLTGSNNRITGDAGFQHDLNYFPVLQGSGAIATTKPSAGPLLLGNDFDSSPNWRADSSLDQLGPIVRSLGNPLAGNGTISALAQIDTITALGTSVTDATTGGAAGLIYHENYTSLVGAGYGSRVVFGSFGLEGLSQDYLKTTIKGVSYYTPRNTRTNVLHNVVCYLRTGTFTGRVTQANGVGVAGVTVYAFGGAGVPGPRQTFSATTLSDGSYTISGLEPGIYSVAAYRTGFTSTTSNTSFPIEGDTIRSNIGLVIAPQQPGRITGTVKDSVTGAGIGGAAVSFTSADGQATYTTTTLPDGTYTIDPVAVGTYIGTASLSPQYGAAPPTQGNPIVVPSGGTAPADFALAAAPATITVTATNSATGQALPGVGVTIAPDPTGAGTLTTDASGVSSFSNLPATLTGTTYTLTGTLAGYSSAAATATVTPGQTAGITLVLTPIPPIANGTLGGLVNDGLGTPLSGATVSVFASGSTTALQTVTTAAPTSPAAPTGNGSPLNYSFSLPPGTYDVTVSKQGFTPVTQTGLVVASAAFTRADFTGTNALQALHLFPAGYNFFSVPYDYTGQGLTFDSIFGVLNQGSFTATPPTVTPANANRSHAYVWQPQLLQYILDPTPPADTLRIGQGYWIYLNNPAELTVAGTVPTSATVSVALGAGWNMIGVPSTSAIPVSGLAIARTGGTPITFADATSASFRILQPTLYTYTAGSPKGTQYTKVFAGGSLEPYQAYWIYAYVDTTLLIPTSPTAVASARQSTTLTPSRASRQNTVRVRGRTF